MRPLHPVLTQHRSRDPWRREDIVRINRESQFLEMGHDHREWLAGRIREKSQGQPRLAQPLQRFTHPGQDLVADIQRAVEIDHQPPHSPQRLHGSKISICRAPTQVDY